MSTAEWTKWNESGQLSIPPYQDWWGAIEKEALKIPDGAHLSGKTDFIGFVDFNMTSGADEKRERTQGNVVEDVKPEFSDIGAIPLAGRVANPDFISGSDHSWMPDEKDLPEINNDAVIVGVIDSGISFAQNRFRDSNGNSRVLAAWQQNATFSKQAYLPFGKELYQKDINTLIQKHSGGQKNGFFDEDAFNLEAGVLDMKNFSGHREAAGRYSHGTHVLDLAAGYDPQAAPDNLKIIVVNLPSRIAFGNSGTFLDYFMYLGMLRIKSLADKIWQKNNKNTKKTDVDGYPLVINLSYGKQAGSKSQIDWFAKKVKGLMNPDPADGSKPSADSPKFEVVMPAGNDNQKRVRAAVTLKKDECKVLHWHVLPEDQTSNYVEIWCTIKSDMPTKCQPVPLAISLTAPNGVEHSPECGVVQKYVSLEYDGKPAARIYCEVKSISKCEYRVHYVLCTAPTLRHNLELPVAPSGIWKINLKNTIDTVVTAHCTIQTDQSILPNAGTGLRSFFDMSDYERFDSQGRMVDSAEYGDLVTAESGKSMVTRKGTINASASLKWVNCIAGYRKSDGKPALYSASGLPEHIAEPIVALPTDDSPALFGILAAGAKNGSRVAMRGTSFASAQAARLFADAWLKGEEFSLQKFGDLDQLDGDYKITASSIKIGERRLKQLMSSDVKR